MQISGAIQTQNLLVTLNKSGLKERPGFAIATGILSSCVRMNKKDEHQTFVRYNPELWCHIYTEVKPIVPFSFTGQQGWKTLDQETINKIEYL